jgi:adenylyl- and sulfurtransferase ThiI
MFFKNASTLEYILLIINILDFSLFWLYLYYNEDNKIKLLKARIEKLEKENNNIDIELSNNLSKLSEKNIKHQHDLNELKSLVLKHHNEYHETFKIEEKRVNEKFDFITTDIKKIKRVLSNNNFI